MYALCVSGAVNTQGFVWKVFLFSFFVCAIYTFSFIHVSSHYLPTGFLRMKITCGLCLSLIHTTRLQDSSKLAITLWSQYRCHRTTRLHYE